MKTGNWTYHHREVRFSPKAKNQLTFKLVFSYFHHLCAQLTCFLRGPNHYIKANRYAHLMTEKERLYETLGELLYVIAKADGIIQDEEKDALNELLENHQWASEIKWSFEYEESKNANSEDIYKKVISFCHGHGPAEEYTEFIDAMKFVAQSANGTEETESSLISSFSSDLIERFQRDIDSLDK